MSLLSCHRSRALASPGHEWPAIHWFACGCPSASSRVQFLTARTGADRDEFAELPTVFDQAKALTTLGRKPLFVFTADLGQQSGWFALQNKLATLSANSVQQTTHGATHAALLEDQSIATATSRAIADVVRAARSSATIAR